MRKPIVIFTPQTTIVRYWHQRSSRPKHYKLILRWRFEVIRTKHESNETTIRPSHSVFQRHWYEIWRVKMHIYGNWKRINYWASRTHYNECRNHKANDGCYKYLGQDENISYVGPINKDRVTKMHTKRMKKIWTSELSAYNKNIAYNAFAVSVLIPTFGIPDWTIQRIKHIDTWTRKILCMTGNFHRNSDIDRLYLQRKRGGKGLKSRVISIRQHLRTRKNKNCYLICELEINFSKVYIKMTTLSQRHVI